MEHGKPPGKKKSNNNNNNLYRVSRLMGGQDYFFCIPLLTGENSPYIRENKIARTHQFYHSSHPTELDHWTVSWFSFEKISVNFIIPWHPSCT